MEDRRTKEKRLVNKFDMEGLFMAQKGVWNIAREKFLRERGHEENFLSSWQREDGREKEEWTAKVSEDKEKEQNGESQKKM